MPWTRIRGFSREIARLPLSRRGGFLALTTPIAGKISGELGRRGIHTDFRGSLLRLGPAPYVASHQLDKAVEALGEVLAAHC